MLYKMWKKLKTRYLWVGKTSKSLVTYTYLPNKILWKKVTITQKIIFNGILQVYFRGQYLVGFFEAIQYGKMWIWIRIRIRTQSPPWIRIRNLIRIRIQRYESDNIQVCIMIYLYFEPNEWSYEQKNKYVVVIISNKNVGTRWQSFLGVVVQSATVQ